MHICLSRCWSPSDQKKKIQETNWGNSSFDFDLCVLGWITYSCSSSLPEWGLGGDGPPGSLTQMAPSQSTAHPCALHLQVQKWQLGSVRRSLLPHHCSPGVVGRGHALLWDKPGLALPASQSAGTACSPWERPRKLLWCFLNPGLWGRLSGQRSPEPLKIPYLDVHAIPSFKTQTSWGFLDHFQILSFFFFLSCQWLNYWDLPQMVISHPPFLVSDI